MVKPLLPDLLICVAQYVTVLKPEEHGGGGGGGVCKKTNLFFFIGQNQKKIF
jgi:hypothetical protein